MWAHLPTGFVGETAHTRERWLPNAEKWVESYLAVRGQQYSISQLLPPPTETCAHTQKPAKIGAVNATAWRFGPEDLVKTFFYNVFRLPTTSPPTPLRASQTR